MAVVSWDQCYLLGTQQWLNQTWAFLYRTIHLRGKGLKGVVIVTHAEYEEGEGSSWNGSSLHHAHPLSPTPAMLFKLWRHHFHLRTLSDGCFREKVMTMLNNPELGQFDEWLRTLEICQRLRSRKYVEQLSSNDEGLPLRNEPQPHLKIPCEHKQDEPSR